MNATLFVATIGGKSGLSLAKRGADQSWSVDVVLPGRHVRCLTADPFDPAILYASEDRDVLRSDDRGRTWQTIGTLEHDVRSLAASPHAAGVLYAGTRPACVFVSRDGGRQWTELEGFRRIRGRRLWLSPAEPPDFRAYVQGLCISPANPDVLVAGIEFGALVQSTDGGENWSNHRRGSLRDCHSLTFHASDGDWVYECGGGGAAFSRDGGATWQRPKVGLDRRYGWACAADPEWPEIWYASASGMPSLLKGQFQPPAHIDGHANAAIYRSAAGDTWQKLGGGLPDPLDYMAFALLTDPAAPGHLYAGMANGEVWHTADYGDSWERLPLNLGGIHHSLMMSVT
jgi:hypothetical protein